MILPNYYGVSCWYQYTEQNRLDVYTMFPPFRWIQTGARCRMRHVKYLIHIELTFIEIVEFLGIFCTVLV